MARAMILLVVALALVAAMVGVELVQAQCEHYSSGQFGCYWCCLGYGGVGDLFGDSNQCECVDGY